jgi:hypothetical protein
MAITLSTAAKNAAVDAVVDLIDVGGAGTLQIATNSGFGSILATLTFQATAFGAAAAGTATVTPSLSSDTNTGAGTATAFRVRNGATTTIFSGTVGASGADINFNSNVFTSGGVCAISSLTVTQP